MHTSNEVNGVTHATNGNSSSVPHLVNQISVAIIGGGIVGCVTALGLLKRGVSVKLYEQAHSFREIGAGLAFTTNAQRCMELTNSDILAAMKAVSTKNELTYYTYKDGYHTQSDDPNDMTEQELFRLHAGKTGFDGCHRAHFLDELVKYIPEGVVEFQKRLHSYDDGAGDGLITLHFEDGTSATADAVIGCDGIRSRVRQLLLGKDNPASHPSFCRKVAFRGLVKMDKAVAALGAEKAHNQCMHMGPNAHVLNFPIAQHTLINVVAFADEADWPHERMTAAVSRQEIMDVFKDWNPTVRTIVSLLEDSTDKWAIFDTYDHPAPSFSRGRVCMAGDAAHASSPHHGAGAGFGVEDALALATAVDEVNATLTATKEGIEAKNDKNTALAAAFQAYDVARRQRCQWLVQSSREVCDVYEWAHPECGRDPEKCVKQIEWRAHKIWYFDIEGMVADVRSAYQRFMPGA